PVQVVAREQRTDTGRLEVRQKRLETVGVKRQVRGRLLQSGTHLSCIRNRSLPGPLRGHARQIVCRTFETAEDSAHDEGLQAAPGALGSLQYAFPLRSGDDHQETHIRSPDVRSQARV